MALYDYDEREATQAAIFDFDGVLFYSERAWKVSHNLGGIIGSTISVRAMYERVAQVRQRRPEIVVTDLFLRDTIDYPDPINEEESNLTPINLLIRTTLFHMERNRDLFTLSDWEMSGVEKLTCRLFQSHNLPPRLPNPLTRIKALLTSEALHSGNGRGHFPTSEDSVEHKLRRIDQLLLRSDEKPRQGRYSHIFLYHCQRDWFAAVERYLTVMRDELEGGRNAILPILISSKREPVTPEDGTFHVPL